MRRKTQNRTTTLTPKGKLLGGMEAAALRKDIKQLVNAGVKHLVLDLSNIQLINGPGIEFLVNTLLRFKKMNGSLELRNPSKKIQEVFEITNLNTVFNKMNSTNTANTHDKMEERSIDPFGFQPCICKP